MSWLSFIPNIFKSGKDVAEVFVENKENKGERSHLERLSDMDLTRSTLAQFSSEFHTRTSRTKWDSFVDGLNRLPRPLLTIGVMGFFVLAPIDPERFMLVAKAYEVIPNGYWALLSVIIGFYFGGRMQLKQADMTLSANHVQAAQELMAMRKTFRELRDDDEKETDVDYQNAVSSGMTKPSNVVIQAWRDMTKS